MVHAAVTVESYVPFNKIEVLVNGKVAAHDEVGADERAGIRVRRFDVDLPIDRSSWIALRVRGPDHPHVFDGPAWAHTSPVYIQVAGQRIASPRMLRTSSSGSSKCCGSFRLATAMRVSRTGGRSKRSFAEPRRSFVR